MNLAYSKMILYQVTTQLICIQRSKVRQTWLGHSTYSWVAELPRDSRPAFETGIQHMKQFAHNWYLLCCRCTGTCSQVSSTQTWYLYDSARCKQPSGESLLLRAGSLLCRVCGTVWLVPVHFWRTGSGGMVRTLGIIACGGVASRLETRVWNWHPAHETIRS